MAGTPTFDGGRAAAKRHHLGELSSVSRQRGRRKLRFKDCAKKDLTEMGILLENWEAMTSDRLVWKTAL